MSESEWIFEIGNDPLYQFFFEEYARIQSSYASLIQDYNNVSSQPSYRIVHMFSD